jgi:DNA-binding Lrp family transcriptional regulator
MSIINLDKYDKQIIELLQQDSSISNVDLAKKLV